MCVHIAVHRAVEAELAAVEDMRQKEAGVTSSLTCGSIYDD
jgi:hypothetical protein